MVSIKEITACIIAMMGRFIICVYHTLTVCHALAAILFIYISQVGQCELCTQIINRPIISIMQAVISLVLTNHLIVQKRVN